MSNERAENDRAVATAICEVLQRPNILFERIKTVDRQVAPTPFARAAASSRRRTAAINRILVLLSAIGMALPLKTDVVRTDAHNHFEHLPDHASTVIGDLLSEGLHHD